MIYLLKVNMLVAAAMFGLYFGVLRHTALFASTPGRAARKLQEFGLTTLPAYVGLSAFIAVVHSFLEEYYWRWFVFGRLRELRRLREQRSNATDDRRGGEDDARPLPHPDGPQRDARPHRLQQDARERGGPADRHAADTDRGEPERAHERSREHDGVSPLVEANSFRARRDHRVCGFRRAWKDPWS